MSDLVWVPGRALVYGGAGQVEYFYRYEGSDIRTVCGGIRPADECRPLEYVCELKYLDNYFTWERFCKHPSTRGRAGTTGSWCLLCGNQVLEVHDRPCNECRHYREDDYPVRRPPYCERKHMLVTNTLHVTYFVGLPVDQGGLCFEPKESTNASD